MINWNDIEDNIKSCNKPLLLFYIIITKCKDDKNLIYFIRYFIKNNENTLLKYNFLLFLNLLNEDCKNIIYDYYNSKVSTINSYNNMLTVKNNYSKSHFWRLDIDKQIEYFEIKKQKLFAINDCSKGNISFSSRIKVLVYEPHNIKHNDTEIAYRLKLIYDLFGYKFFELNKIILITMFEYNSMDINGKVKYVEYIFNKTKTTINKIINKLKVYNTYKKSLKNLLNPKIINIEMSTNLSDDIDFDF